MFNAVSLWLDLNQWFCSFVSQKISLCLFIQVLILTFLEAFHSLFEITSWINFQPLFFPLIFVSRLNYSFKNIGICWWIIGLFFNQIFSDNLNDSKIFPHSFNKFSTSRILIINNKSLSRSGNSSIKEFKIWAKFSIIIDVLHYFFYITDNFFNLNIIVCLFHYTLRINNFLLFLLSNFL